MVAAVIVMEPENSSSRFVESILEFNTNSPVYTIRRCNKRAYFSSNKSHPTLYTLEYRIIVNN